MCEVYVLKMCSQFIAMQNEYEFIKFSNIRRGRNWAHDWSLTCFNNLASDFFSQTLVLYR